jgi:hypothetical protein
MQKMGFKAQFDTGFSVIVTVPGYGEFKYSGATRRPFDTVIPEAFKVVDGKIVEIEATMASIPFGSHSGWE